MKRIRTIALTLLFFLGVFLLSFQTSNAANSNAWDKSSLVASGQGGNCDEIFAVILNGGDGDLQSTVRYEVYFSASGNPKNGDIEGSGTLGPLPSGETVTITYTPTNSGNYMFKIYQADGHPGTGVLWSDQISIMDCSEPPTEEPPTEEPPTEEPPTEQPPTEQPPTEQPPTEQPPTEQPPTDTPTNAAPNNPTGNTPVKQTVNGGQLPVTSSPWYNLLLFSSLSVFSMGYLMWRLRKKVLD